MHLAYCGGGRQTFGGLKDGSIQSGHCPNRAALFRAKGQAPSLEYVGGGRGVACSLGIEAVWSFRPGREATLFTAAQYDLR